MPTTIETNIISSGQTIEPPAFEIAQTWKTPPNRIITANNSQRTASTVAVSGRGIRSGAPMRPPMGRGGGEGALIGRDGVGGGGGGSGAGRGGAGAGARGMATGVGGGGGGGAGTAGGTVGV